MTNCHGSCARAGCFSGPVPRARQQQALPRVNEQRAGCGALPVRYAAPGAAKRCYPDALIVDASVRAGARAGKIVRR
jgi:hypothetical protein